MSNDIIVFLILGFLVTITGFYIIGNRYKNLTCKKHGTPFPCMVCDEELKKRDGWYLDNNGHAVIVKGKKKRGSYDGR